MRNFWIVFVALAVVIGCGGGGGNGGGGAVGGGGTTSQVPAPTVALTTDSANLQFTIVTGQGRRGPGDMVVSMSPVGGGALNVRNTDFDVLSTPDPVSAMLTSYALYSVSATRLVPPSLPYLTFTVFPLTLTGLSGTDTDGNNFSEWTGTFLAGTFPSDVMMHRGRDTVLQFTLNDAIITGRNFSGPIFDVNQFQEENLDPISGNIESLFSDFVAFDISGMGGADRPNLIVNGNPGPDADMILFTGDTIALSAGFDTLGSLMILDPRVEPVDNVDTGRIDSPTVVGGTATEGTYTLFEPDWRLIDPTQGIIVSLQGRWRPYTQVLSNIGTYMMVAFPNSRNETDGFTAVYIRRDVGGNVTALWQGPIRFTGPDANEIRLTRVRDIVSGLEVNPAVGTLSALQFSNGEVTSGTFTFAGVPGDFPFPLTGQFRVFRR